MADPASLTICRCSTRSSSVHLAAYTLTEPQPNELVVRVSAASINPMDWKIRNGDMKMMTGSKFPRGMGTDFSGTVETVGAKVPDFKPGDSVVGTGAVGRAAISMARGIGAEVVGRVGPQSVAHAHSLGLKHALDYTKPIPANLNKTFDIVFDANGSLSPGEGDRLIKHGGKVIDIVPTPPSASTARRSSRFEIARLGRMRRRAH